MTADAEAWSEHDLDHRFDAGEPHDELTHLAATFDRMLDRLAASLRREQRFSAELSHELRTPLAAIVAEAELALRRERTPRRISPAPSRKSPSAHASSRESSRCSAASAEGRPAWQRRRGHVAEYAVDSCAPLAAENQRRPRACAEPRTPLRVGVDRDAAERVLAPMVENACRYARSRTSVEIRSEQRRHVEFSSPTTARASTPSEREQVFEPGKRGSAAPRGSGGAGLGLALSRRLALALGGEVDGLGSESGGRFRVRLPLG